MAKLIESENDVKAFLQEPSDSQGDLVILIDTAGTPVEAKAFGRSIVDFCKLLESLDESKTCRWAIIEAAIIGTHASFTLRGYDKQAFKVKPEKPKA